MKRILSFSLCLAICLTFVACGNDRKKTKKIGVDVEYYANLGKMPEFKYALGSDGQKAAEEISKSLKDSTDNHYGYCNTYEGDEQTSVEISGINFKYDNKTKKINKIISYSTAYEFDIGTVSLEIQKALASYGFESKIRPLTDEEASLVASSTESTALEYKFKDNYVLFVFYENALLATVLYSAK